jgi:hypothetical protein
MARNTGELQVEKLETGIEGLGLIAVGQARWSRTCWQERAMKTSTILVIEDSPVR